MTESWRWWAVALVVSACGPPRYVPPAADEPHAQVTVRVLHHALPGPILSHDTLLNGDAIPIVARDGTTVGVPITRSVRVRPGRGLWQFESRFAHIEQRLRTVYETERQPCGTSRVGSGSTSRLETRYCTRQVPRQRLQSVRVPDGTCAAAFVLQATAGRRYLVQYDFYAHEQCRARCFSREGTAGVLQLVPCGAGRRAPPQPSRVSSGGESPGRSLTTPNKD